MKFTRDGIFHEIITKFKIILGIVTLKISLINEFHLRISINLKSKEIRLPSNVKLYPNYDQIFELFLSNLM